MYRSAASSAKPNTFRIPAALFPPAIVAICSPVPRTNLYVSQALAAHLSVWPMIFLGSEGSLIGCLSIPFEINPATLLARSNICPSFLYPTAVRVLLARAAPSETTFNTVFQQASRCAGVYVIKEGYGIFSLFCVLYCRLLSTIGR